MLDVSASPQRCTFFIGEFNKGRALTHPAASSGRLWGLRLSAARGGPGLHSELTYADWIHLVVMFKRRASFNYT